MAETVLVVDDDRGFRSVYRALLEEDGYRVLESGSLPEAAATFGREGPRLVVLDLMLPPSGRPEAGAALCERLLGERPATKVIVVSGTGETGLALGLVRRGAYDFIAKPVEPEVLLAVLRRAEARLRLEDRVVELEASLAAPPGAPGLLGGSGAFLGARALAEGAAPT